MKLGLRIFLFYLAIFAACLYFTTDWIWTTLRTRYLESVEEPLVDTANLLASLVEREMERPGFGYSDLESALARAHIRPLDVRIYGLRKSNVDLQVYITDAAGTVVFDTRSPHSVGQSYRRFRDVKMTLAGEVRRPRHAARPLRPLLDRALRGGADLQGRQSERRADGGRADRQHRRLPSARPAGLRARRPPHRRRGGPAQPPPLLLADPSHRPPRALRGRHPPGEAPAVPQAREHRDRRPGAGPAADAGGARRETVRGGVRPDAHPRIEEPALRDPRRGGAPPGGDAPPAAGPLHRQHPPRGRADRPHRGPHAGAGAAGEPPREAGDGAGGARRHGAHGGREPRAPPGRQGPQDGDRRAGAADPPAGTPSSSIRRWRTSSRTPSSSAPGAAR